MAQPHFDHHLSQYHSILEAYQEVKKLLEVSKTVPFWRVEAVARRHHVEMVSVLNELTSDAKCRLDYTAAEVVCL